MSIIRKIKRGTYNIVSIRGKQVVCRRTSSVTKGNETMYFDKATGKHYLPISQG